MSDEIRLNEVDVQKINPQPGEVIIVTIKSDDVDASSMQALRNSMRAVFPNNQVMIMSVGSEGDIKFVVAKDASLSDTKVGCGTTPNNFCSDCSCGKKEAYEQNKG